MHACSRSYACMHPYLMIGFEAAAAVLMLIALEILLLLPLVLQGLEGAAGSLKIGRRAAVALDP